jgi:hypothetical protein
MDGDRVKAATRERRASSPKPTPPDDPAVMKGARY